MTRGKFIALLGFGFVAFVAAEQARAELKVFACEPEWAALASEIGGNKVSVFTATTAKQDPHQVQARLSTQDLAVGPQSRPVNLKALDKRYITSDPEILRGRPRLKGPRIPFSLVLG